MAQDLRLSHSAAGIVEVGTDDLGNELERQRRIQQDFSRLDSLLEQNPMIAERTEAMLDGRLPSADLEVTIAMEVPTSLRLPSKLLKRADALVSKLKKDPELSLGRVSRAFVLRLAVQRGIEALEEEYGRAKRHR